MKICSVPDCGKPYVARDFCQNHYRVFMRRGTPIPPPRTHGIFTATGGYLFRMMESKTRYLHIDVAEKALGKPLPPSAEIHHVNDDPADNRPDNLVICPNHQYHMMLHQRMRALNACGNPNWLHCRHCKTYAPPDQLNHSGKNIHYHPACAAENSRRKRRLAKINRSKSA